MCCEHGRTPLPERTKRRETGSLRLGHRTVDDRQRRHFVDCMKPHSRNDAHDFRHDITLFVVSSINCEALADRVLAREKLFRQRLVDDDHARRIFGVAIIEHAAAKKRHLEGREIIAGDRLPDRRLACCSATAAACLRDKIRFAIRPSADEFEPMPALLNPGSCADFIEQRLGKRFDLLAARIGFPRPAQVER